jgi:hypothetical protein
MPENTISLKKTKPRRMKSYPRSGLTCPLFIRIPMKNTHIFKSYETGSFLIAAACLLLLLSFGCRAADLRPGCAHAREGKQK